MTLSEPSVEIADTMSLHSCTDTIPQRDGNVVIDIVSDGLASCKKIKKRKKKRKKKKVPRHLQNAPFKRLVHVTEKSVAWPFLLSVIAVTFAIVLGVPFMIVLLAVFYPFVLLVRCALNNCCRCIKRHMCQNSTTLITMSPQDSYWMHCGPSTMYNPITVSLFFFERGLGLSKIRELLLRRVVLAEDGRGHRLYPRFAQRVISLTAGYCWADDNSFDVDNHVYLAPSSARTHEGLERYLSALINRTLHPDRPLWDVQVLSDYGDAQDTVLIVRTHHCLSDAISLVKILRVALCDTHSSSGGGGGCGGGSVKQRFGGTTYPLNVFRAFIVGPMTLLSWLFCFRRDCNLLRHRGQTLSGTTLMAWSDDISLSQVVRIKQVSRSTLNDVILSALTGSLRSYFQRNGIKRPYKLRANFGVDLRYESRNSKRKVRMGNKYALVNVDLPINQEGSIPRLWEVRSIMDDLKTSAEPVVMYGAITLLETFLPQCLSRWIVSRILSGASLVYTNIPGPEHAIHALSMRLKSIVCFVPPRDSVPLSITVTTNVDVLKLSVLVDEAVLPHPQFIIDEFVSQIELMSQILSSRRIPGEHRRRSYFIITANNFNRSPPVEEVQNKLYTVQEELHEITQRLEASSLSGDFSAQDRADLALSQQLLLSRMERLKEEFSELLSELRRRKSLADGIPISDEDEDLDGEIRRPRKRTLSVSSRRSSINSMTSTARPLTTPSTSHHSSLVTAYDALETSSPERHKEY